MTIKIKEKESAVDIKVYLPFCKTLIKKYGNFKMSQELHNLIIYNLCEICDMIETQLNKTPEESVRSFLEEERAKQMFPLFDKGKK